MKIINTWTCLWWWTHQRRLKVSVTTWWTKVNGHMNSSSIHQPDAQTTWNNDSVMSIHTNSFSNVKAQWRLSFFKQLNTEILVQHANVLALKLCSHSAVLPHPPTLTLYHLPVDTDSYCFGLSFSRVSWTNGMEHEASMLTVLLAKVDHF